MATRCLLVVVALLLAGCATEEPGPSAATTSTAPGTTLPLRVTPPPGPSREATAVDACSLLRDGDVAALIGDGAGSGEAEEQPVVDEGEPPPALLRARCAWPSLDDPVLTVDYLAPATATTGVEHLEAVLAADGTFGEGGRVVEVERGGEVVAALLGADDQVLETAVVKRSALVWLTTGFDVSARSPEFQTLVDHTAEALRRAPR